MSYFVHESSYIDSNVSIGDGTKIWYFCHIQNDVSIGMNTQLGQNVFVDRNVKIGSNVKIQNNVSVYEGVVLEDGVFIGPSSVFTNDLTPRALFPKSRNSRIKTLVKTGATIGANSTIVCGNTIGAWAMVGAGAVVTEDVKDHALVVGNPARQVGWVCKCGSKLDDNKKCKVCGLHLFFERNNDQSNISVI